jgi:hypothetical protein
MARSPSAAAKTAAATLIDQLGFDTVDADGRDLQALGAECAVLHGASLCNASSPRRQARIMPGGQAPESGQLLLPAGPPVRRTVVSGAL